MGLISDYLDTIDEPDKAALERVYAIAADTLPQTTEGMSYAMAALIYRGKGLISAMQTKKFLSIYPYSGSVVAAVLDDLEGFETTSGSIHFSAEHPIPEATIRRIVQVRRAEIDAKAG